MNKILLFQPPETHDCSYLPDQQARSLYADPRVELDEETLTLLSLNGFRRSGRLVYRPNCPDCNACIAVRLRVRELQLKRSHKRNIKRNADLTLEIGLPIVSDEIYSMYERYISQRHADGDMFPPSIQQFTDFLGSDFGTTRYLIARKGDQLIACMVFDLLGDGLSSVYCFYEPDEEPRSPGTYLIIRLSQIASALNLPYNYLGYYVRGCRKMEYKLHFSPMEQLCEGRWQLLSP
ncbi:arginyltransferase [Thalassolituus marinus]|uniref:Aspartate/glutamate leucyltransferase n=1 Tax=Thalassolituus marinus TaxID=671053 RepID=A0ABS7ZQW1_9GAMM|nr:arginyltransferase [Thalassolituus marinus]MCA6064106.1 arginyltransferase [Thalassolituus marinus]